MKLNKIFKFLISSVLLIVQIISFSFFSYSLILYKGVETFYRYYGIAILLYLLLFMSYLLFRGIKKKNWTGFIVSAIVTILIIGVEAFGYYYLNKIYKSIDSYSENTNEYYSVLVTYNKSYNSYKDLNNKTIGIVNDKKDIEGNILPNEIINELQLSDNNTIKEYTSTMELLYEHCAQRPGLPFVPAYIEKHKFPSEVN